MEIVVTKRKLRISLIFALTVVAIVFLAKKPVNESYDLFPTANAQELKEEFYGSYLEGVDMTGKVVEIDLTASEGSIEIIDGYMTNVWNYNNTVPGPEIRVSLGDTLKVNFKNELSDETTIHWHGVRVPNAMDGVPGVTQEPIQPGKTYTYEFTPKDAGTFWFHPHVRGAEQVERGLFGTLIVEDDISKQYSKDIVWVVDDWRLTEDNQVNPYFVTAGDLMHDGRWGNVITVNASTNEILNVNPGERIRLRMVNTSNARVYMPNFGRLDAEIIAVDGFYTKEPIDANSFELAPGNRIDVDIKIALDADGKDFKIFDNFTGYSNKLGTISISGQTMVTPSFEYPTNPNIPNWESASNYEVDKTYILNAKRGMGMMGIEWTINGKAYPDYDPFTFKYNEFNKVTFQNDSYRLHPMHLHGQFFKVLERNGLPVNEPYFRDTVLVSSQEVITVGLVPLDKGTWVQHCHILEHAEAGMMTVVEVK